jgi:hypothetical protein
MLGVQPVKEARLFNNVQRDRRGRGGLGPGFPCGIINTQRDLCGSNGEQERRQKQRHVAEEAANIHRLQC